MRSTLIRVVVFVHSVCYSLDVVCHLTVHVLKNLSPIKAHRGMKTSRKVTVLSPLWQDGAVFLVVVVVVLGIRPRST